MKIFLLINAHNCWQFNFDKQENSIIGLTEPENAEFLDIFLYSGAFKNACPAELSMNFL